jgi:hypothetical protein
LLISRVELEELVEIIKRLQREVQGYRVGSEN